MDEPLENIVLTAYQPLYALDEQRNTRVEYYNEITFAPMFSAL